jgi:hypothetical protein
MKKIATALIAAAIAASAVSPAAAATCLDTTRIRNTHVVDARNILFKMYDGTTWNVSLRNACPGLKFNGFVYKPFASQEICENAQTIRVLQSGETCMLGGFTKVTPAPKA